MKLKGKMDYQWTTDGVKIEITPVLADVHGEKILDTDIDKGLSKLSGKEVVVEITESE